MTARLTEEYLTEVARQLMQGSRLSVETGNDLLAEVRALTAERDELQQTFDLMWDADQRAIKRWQAAGEDRDLIWPDRTKLTEWLLTEHDALQRQLNAAMRVVDAGREWKRVRAALSAEHPRTFPTNRNLTTAQFAFDAAIAALDATPSRDVNGDD